MQGLLPRNTTAIARLAGLEGLNGGKENCWMNFLQRLADQVGAASAARIVHDFARGQSRLCETVNVDPGFIARFDVVAPVLNGVLRRPEHTFTAGLVIRVDESETFLDRAAADRLRRAWSDPQGLGDVLCGLVLGDAEQCILLLFGRRRGQPKFSDKDATVVLGALSGAHLVWRSERQLKAARHHALASWATLEALAVGVVLIDGTGRVHRINRAGKDIISRHTGLTAINSHLSCVHSRDAGRLRQAIDALVSADPGAERHDTVPLAVHRSDDASVLPVILCRVDRRTGVQRPDQMLLAVFLCDQERITAPNQAWLHEWYGLSRVDAEIAVALARGLSPDEIAQRMRSSIHTVRAHLKRIFWKTGVARQAKLIRLLLAGTAIIGSDGRSDPGDTSRG